MLLLHESVCVPTWVNCLISSYMHISVDEEISSLMLNTNYSRMKKKDDRIIIDMATEIKCVPLFKHD